MKRIPMYGRKTKVIMITEALNKAKIIKQEFPLLKVHNRVPDKKYNNSILGRANLTLEDIKKHSESPSSLEYQLKLREQNAKRYYLEESTYKTDIDFVDTLELKGDKKEITYQVWNYIKKKLTSLNTDTLEYYFDDYFAEYDSEELHELIGGFIIKKYEDNVCKCYYEPHLQIRINIYDNSDNEHNNVTMSLANLFIIDFNIYV